MVAGGGYGLNDIELMDTFTMYTIAILQCTAQLVKQWKYLIDALLSWVQIPVTGMWQV
jgi:hypothetical protein